MTQSEKLAQLRRMSGPMAGMESLFERIQMVKGDKGEKGEKGDAPVKGKDYFTPQEINSIISHIQSQIVPGAKGDEGKKGDKGDTPIKGLDYWTKDEQETIIRDVLSRIPKPQEVVVDHDAIAEIATKKLTGTKQIKIEHVDGLSKTLTGLKDFLKTGGYRGGGDTVLAGTGVSISIGAGGQKTISASTAGFTTLTPTGGLVNSANTVFVFTQAPQMILADGVMLPATGNNGTVFWTIVGFTVTTMNPPTFSLLGVA